MGRLLSDAVGSGLREALSKKVADPLRAGESVADPLPVAVHPAESKYILDSEQSQRRAASAAGCVTTWSPRRSVTWGSRCPQL